MKKLKKLSLKKEIEREAEALEKEVSGRKDLDHITVSEDMEEALFQKIQDYEYEKRAKVVYRKKKRRYAIIAVAAVFILVFGSVMTGVGSKSYWKVWWDRDESGEKASYIDVENMDLQEIEDTNEVYIYKEISKQLGILPVRLIYKPDRMALKNYEINQDLKKATLLYKHEDEVIKYTMYMNDVDSSFAQKEPDNLINEYVLCLNNGMEIQVKEYEEKEEKVKRYEAEFEYAGAQYDEKNDEWGQIDAWVAEDENNYYLSTAKSLKVDRGYYYRVHCDHIAGNEYPYEENASTTNGILIP